jgi:hypothetical protein
VTPADTKGPKDAVDGNAVAAVIKRDFSIQFGREQLTSYGGLELLRRFLVLIDLREQCDLPPPGPHRGTEPTPWLPAIHESI